MRKKNNYVSDLSESLNRLYEVNDVERGYRYWFAKLLNITLSIFDYENLPVSLPAREIELQLQLTGHCIVFTKEGELVTTLTSLYDFDKYYQPTKYTYAQPVLGSGSFSIDGFNNSIIYNSSLKDNIMGVRVETGLLTFIQRYARRLADIESTLNIYTVNNRNVGYPVACNEKVKSSLQRFFERIALGFREAISDDSIIRSFQVEPIPKNNSGEIITQWQEARDKIMEEFFRDIGVKFRNPKKAQLNTEEVESDEQVLLISLDDMLKCREEGVKAINDKFNTNIRVKISDNFDRSTPFEYERSSEDDGAI